MKAVHLVTVAELLELTRLDSFWQRPDPTDPFGFVLAQAPSQVPKYLYFICGKRGLAPAIRFLHVPLLESDGRRTIKQLHVWQYGGKQNEVVVPRKKPTKITCSQDELMNVATLEAHCTETLFKDLYKLHRQATAARDRRAEGASGQRKYESTPPWRVLDNGLARTVLAKLPVQFHSPDMDIRVWSGRVFNDDQPGQRIVSGLFKTTSKRVQALRADSGPDGIIFQRPRAGGASNQALDDEKDMEDFVPIARGTTMTDAITQTAALEGGRGLGYNANGALFFR
eukprot:4823027-Pyramimonas_sp.AAC.1